MLPHANCPMCNGAGVVGKCGWAVQCPICEANTLGMSHIKTDDPNLPQIIDGLIVCHNDDGYWAWLQFMVFYGYIDPKKHHEIVKKKEVE